MCIRDSFQTIRTRIDYMIDLQQKREQGYFRLLPKKEGVKLEETLVKLEKYFLGIKDMTALPSAMFVVDIVKESICIAEAHRMGIPIFSILDSDCDPSKILHPIPGNDDAVRSIRLITNRMATAILEGVAEREALLQENEEPQDSEDLESTEEERVLSSLETAPLEELAEMMQQTTSDEGSAEDSNLT